MPPCGVRASGPAEASSCLRLVAPLRRRHGQPCDQTAAALAHRARHVVEAPQDPPRQRDVDPAPAPTPPVRRDRPAGHARQRPRFLHAELSRPDRPGDRTPACRQHAGDHLELSQQHRRLSGVNNVGLTSGQLLDLRLHDDARELHQRHHRDQRRLGRLSCCRRADRDLQQPQPAHQLSG